MRYAFWEPKSWHGGLGVAAPLQRGLCLQRSWSDKPPLLGACSPAEDPPPPPPSHSGSVSPRADQPRTWHSLCTPG